MVGWDAEWKDWSHTGELRAAIALNSHALLVIMSYVDQNNDIALHTLLFCSKNEVKS